MSPGRDPGRLGNDGLDDEQDDESPRSLFSALWFRALLAVLVLGVIAAVAVPYVLDLPTTSPLKFSTAKSTTTPPPPATAAPGPTAATAAPADSPAPSPDSPPPATASSTAKPEEPPVATARPAAPKSAATKTVAPKAAQAAKPPTPKPTMVAKAAESSKVAEAPKAPAKAPESPKVAEAPKPPTKAVESPKKPAAASSAAPKAGEHTKPIPPTPGSAAPGRPYWVQVGAFKDAETAKKIAGRLRDQGLRVEESTIVPAAPRASSGPAAQTPPDRYDVLVSGVTAADIEPKLTAKGLKGENTANGAVVRPSLALREAVALSRDLADAGLSVQVRRIGGAAPAPTAPASAPSASPPASQTLYRVRVGGYTERAAAADALKQLEDKGFRPFIARGNE
jgi:cell division septation protein DedD